VLPLDTPLAQIEATYGGQPIRAKIESVQQVGHIVLVATLIGATELVFVEGHSDKYAGRFSPGDDVLLAWRREAATLITH
jgi:hypothetical protein